MPDTLHPRTDPASLPWLNQRLLRSVVVAALSACVLVAAIGTIHWPIVGDAPLLHYVVFLLDHGKIPYRDIVEIDMPGTYALQWAAIHVLGPGPLAWRFFDFGLLAAVMAAMIAITLPDDWLAGFFAGALFALIHFRDGPTDTGQRDLMMTTMVILACAFLFHTVRPHPTRRPLVWTAAVFGLFLGMAAIVKPSGVLFSAVLILLLWLHLYRTHRPVAPCLTAAVGGLALPILAATIYLVHYHALGAFLAIDRGIVAYHAALGRPPLLNLIVGSFPSVLLAIAIPALPLFVIARPWKQWQGLVLLSCVVLGALSYIIQGKGFPHHRYPVEAFLLLLCSTLLLAALRQTGWPRGVAVAGLLLGALYLAPLSAAIALHYDGRDLEFEQLLTADLNGLGGPSLDNRSLDNRSLDNRSLDNKVQCLEMAAECHTTLYDMKLVEATPFMYDCYMFQARQTAVSLQYREDFWAAIHANPPQVFILTDQECFTQTRNFGLPDRWPQFRRYLQSDYTLAVQRTPPHLLGWWRHPAIPFSYQLYVRKPAGATAP